MTTSKLPISVSHFDIVKGSSLGIITSSGWPFVSAVLSQMAHLVANITLNSARSCVMQSAFLTQGTVSSISIIFSWGGSISPEGFLSSVLLWLVIIVAVVGVGVTVVVVMKFFCRQTFICDHLILAPECVLLPDPLASGLC
ncbi:hypothetical protein Tco_1410563 [Tanacetum coccineum]